MFPQISLGGLIYLGVGVVISAQHHYWHHLVTVGRIASALLATVLWPALLFGVNLHAHHLFH